MMYVLRTAVFDIPWVYVKRMPSLTMGIIDFFDMFESCLLMKAFRIE